MKQSQNNLESKLELKFQNVMWLFLSNGETFDDTTVMTLFPNLGGLQRSRVGCETWLLIKVE